MPTEDKSQIRNLLDNEKNSSMKSRISKNNNTEKNINQNGKQEEHVSNHEEENKKDKFSLPSKQFSIRESYILQLFEQNRTIKAVYNIFVANYILFIFAFTLKEYMNHQRLPKALLIIPRSFGKMHLVAMVWLGNNFATFSTYYLFLLWGKTRQKVIFQKLWDILWILLLITYYIMSFVVITKVVFALNLPFASAIIITMESVRFLMKVHAFVRHNAPRMLHNSNDKTIDCLSFSKFLYFLYIPTIIYRDHYPRLKVIRWGFVFYRLLEIANIIIFLAYWYEYVITPYFKETCLKTWSALEVFLLFIEFCIPAYLIILVMFFTVLHSIQNAVGELLRFGDRLFYADWWNCTNVQQYYRKWNLVIGDWLYTYIHKDMYEIIAPGNRNLGKIVTVLISAVVHEWICTVCSGYFLPLHVPLMTFSTICMYVFRVKEYSTAANIVYIIMIMLGTNIIITFYAFEHFTRLNFPSNKQFVSLFFTNNCVRF
ncbi:sterol O-acyltransferase 1-like isoform X1 [Diabrotica undecimpunctata]|uniref:sterol O-acyltransferase 1-like isoform X1 n=2 Tax=Diabrotica undecimpunctata TaxID=50387 RepID=UPI003B63FAAB